MALDLQQLDAELEAAKAHFNSWALNSIETADDTRRRHLDFIRDSKGEMSHQAEQLFTTLSGISVTCPPAVEMEKLEDRQQELSQQAQILKQREGLQAPKGLRPSCTGPNGSCSSKPNLQQPDGRLFATRPSGVCIVACRPAAGECAGGGAAGSLGDIAG